MTSLSKTWTQIVTSLVLPLAVCVHVHVRVCEAA